MSSLVLCTAKLLDKLDPEPTQVGNFDMTWCSNTFEHTQGHGIAFMECQTLFSFFSLTSEICDPRDPFASLLDQSLASCGFSNRNRETLLGLCIPTTLGKLKNRSFSAMLNARVRNMQDSILGSDDWNDAIRKINDWPLKPIGFANSTDKMLHFLENSAN